MNPYEAPITETPSIETESLFSAQEILRAWWKAAKIYNALLLVVGVVSSYKLWLSPTGENIAFAVIFGLMANGCFFAGMLLEFFVSWIFKSPGYPALRMMVFTLGFAFALFFTAFCGMMTRQIYF